MSLVIYPNPDSWDDFYPSNIFIALGAGEKIEDAINVFVKANIGATILIGTNATQSQTYKKVGEIKSLVELISNVVLLRTADSRNIGN